MDWQSPKKKRIIEVAEREAGSWEVFVNGQSVGSGEASF